RPCLDPRDLDRLVDEASATPAGGLLAAPCTDTMKRADEHVCVEATLPREVLWRAATPQMFRYAALCAALERAHAERRLPTDESQAMEWQGARPRLVPTAASNIKITSEDDLALAETVLARRKGCA
ncbi:MAG: 2-C-methyl-D-erythritol 4-phosphate cytidylyltransferase, partial [Steroidobacteraceae bacterium]